MRQIMFLPLILLLSGCVRETPVSETVLDSALQQVAALEQTLAPECKTDTVITQTAVIKTQIRAAKQSCKAEKADIIKQKRKWQFYFWALSAAIICYIIRKILK
jgi:hypothetical protein